MHIWYQLHWSGGEIGYFPTYVIGTIYASQLFKKLTQENPNTFDEIVEDIKHGIYMHSFTEWNIDDRRYQSKYVGSYARLIKNGEITDTFVRRPILEITSRGLFEAVDACSKGFAAWQAICGKSDPGQGMPVWTAGPDAVRLRDIRLGGAPT